MKYLRTFTEDYCVLDLETTGLSPKNCDIIEIGILKIRSGQVVDTFCQFVKPTMPISPFITQLTGISNAMVEQAPSIDQVLPFFLEFIGNDVLVGHNMKFDLSFIQKHCTLQNAYSDTLHMAQKRFPQLSHHRLSDMQTYLHLSKNTHRSIADCQTTYELYEYMKGMR